MDDRDIDPSNMNELLRQAARGDREAMARFTADHYASVYRFCARRIGPDMASDAAQETFITAQRKLSQFNGSSTPLTWLLGIALNVTRNLHRKKGKNAVPYDDLWNEQASGLGESGLIDRQVLRDALKKLPPEQLAVIVLHEIEGLTYEETAKVLEIPVGTVKSRIHSAFGVLRRAFHVEVPNR